jgi:hypothetical protein
MKRVWISKSGVPMMPRVFTSSRHGGTPQAMKNASEAWSIQRLKFGKKTMPAGSQSPNCTCTRCTWLLLFGASGLTVGCGCSSGRGIVAPPLSAR